MRGFSLIEVLVALLIFSGGVLGLLSMQNMSIHANTFSRDMIIASDLAHDIVENMQNLNYFDPVITDSNSSNNAQLGSIDLNNDVPNPAPEQNYSSLASSNFKSAISNLPNANRFQRYWNIADIDVNGDGISDAKNIAVIVRWRDKPDGRYRQVTLYTSLDNPSV